MKMPDNPPKGNPNTWQMIARSTNDVVTPANIIDAGAFGLAMHGANHLDKWSGIAESGASLIADFIDGKVARATGTTSEIGEALDAGGDKIKLAKFLFKIWRDEQAPKSLISAIAAQNVANVALTAYDRKTNNPPKIHASADGKKAIFIQQAGLGIHVIGNKMGEKHPKAGKRLKQTGSVLGWAGVAWGLKATYGYAKDAGIAFDNQKYCDFIAVFDGELDEDEFCAKYPKTYASIK